MKRVSDNKKEEAKMGIDNIKTHCTTCGSRLILKKVWFRYDTCGKKIKFAEYVCPNDRFFSITTHSKWYVSDAQPTGGSQVNIYADSWEGS